MHIERENEKEKFQTTGAHRGGEKEGFAKYKMGCASSLAGYESPGLSDYAEKSSGLRLFLEIFHGFRNVTNNA